ncbi:MAG: bifunctional phosphoribosyl-AMP cyclohydrolase/phosphoribosyl-ATP diphosphatase HisIE [Paludibacteraceae bacterium]|nr:bifunctional phosphoribosyl-AMP cyclohydrolase/phosphoribosyl-ATP diphosphatase HisIE [Paludibacteraceae bacterium]MCR5569809.1 bifunctional phosphoribosyl-AMP cyclohydrolase/phosphoribosyl-ATP diphosphatase HisIE [Paludibacteraceae bacterium]
MKPDFEKMGGLVPAIVQDADTRKVLMLGFMNEEAYQKTIDTKKVTFYSRTRQKLWTKGETSGNFLNMVSMAIDCDNDTLLIQVHPVGPVCHTGTDTCWGDTNKSDLNFLSSLQDLIELRKAEMPEGSYTAKLFGEGVNRMAQMVGEEALSTLIASTHGSNEQVLAEAADLVYHLMVLLSSKNMRIEDVVAELYKRRSNANK